MAKSCQAVTTSSRLRTGITRGVSEAGFVLSTHVPLGGCAAMRIGRLVLVTTDEHGGTRIPRPFAMRSSRTRGITTGGRSAAQPQPQGRSPTANAFRWTQRATDPALGRTLNVGSSGQTRVAPVVTHPCPSVCIRGYGSFAPARMSWIQPWLRWRKRSPAIRQFLARSRSRPSGRAISSAALRSGRQTTRATSAKVLPLKNGEGAWR